MIVVITCFHVDRGAALSCLNEFGQSVDWFVIYKIPKLKSSVKPFDSGRSYVYFTSDQAKDDEWQLSPNLIHQDSSLLARTLNQVYRNVRNSTYIQYNDEPPLSIRHVAGVY